jgi:fragilysin
MKKNMFRIGSLVFLLSLLLSSCSNEQTTVKDTSRVVDLNNFTFSEVEAVIHSGSAVVLKDGEKEIPVSQFSKEENTEISTGKELVTTYEANDSITVSLCSNFVSVRIGKEGAKTGYVSYANAADMDEVAKTYAGMGVNTKSAESLVTLSASGSSFKINITGAQKANAALTKGSVNEAMENDYIRLTKEQKDSVAARYAVSEVQTKADSYLFPRNKIVTIHLLIGKGACKPIPHELVWQEKDAQKSITDVFKKDKEHAPKLVFSVEDCDFKSTEKASKDLGNFYDYVYANRSRFPAVGKDIYFLVRQWGWGFGGFGSDAAIGIAYMHAYNINSYSNRIAFGMSATSCLYSTTLAHELGHIFGAEHSTTPWYRLNKDLMNATNHIWNSGLHRTDIKQGTSNRDIIAKNLIQE